MEDLIKRSDVLDLLKKLAADHFEFSTRYEHYLEIGVEIEDAVKALPSAEPQRWIPVADRLPNANERDKNGVRRYYLVQNEYGDMMVCSWNGREWEQIYQLEPTDGEIVAWMPLPEPYKGEEDDQKSNDGI